MFYISGRPEYGVAHHTIWLGKRFKGLLKDIFDRGNYEVFLYVHSLRQLTRVLPSGWIFTFYVCPNLKSNGWEIGETFTRRDRVALSRTILPDLEATITSVFGWIHGFSDDYRSAWRSFQLTDFRQSAWFRYRNQDPKIRNLFFTGAGTHPGAGLPGVVSSAKVVETLLKESSDHNFS